MYQNQWSVPFGYWVFLSNNGKNVKKCVYSESELSIYHYLLDMGQLQKKGTSFIFFNWWLFSCQYVGMSTVVLSSTVSLFVALVTHDQHHSDDIKWKTPEITIHKINN